MDVPTITMDPEKAAEKLEHYRAMRPERLTEDDLATMAGYEALAKDNPIIDLAAAMRDAGLDDKGMPWLAIARADRRFVTFTVCRNGGGEFRAHRLLGGQTANVGMVLPERTWDWTGRRYSTFHRFAYLPTIPPEHRPAPSQLRRYHVLWEAVWEPAPPVDPFLLKHLHGMLYVVLAQWDLTELEQAVLRGRIAADAR